MTYEAIQEIALHQLGSMYQPDHELFVFRRRLAGGRLVAEGLSRRYTAIALIGLAGTDPAVVHEILHRRSAAELCQRLIATTGASDTLGDLALFAWAAVATGCDSPTPAWDHLATALDHSPDCPIVDLSWAVSALSLAGDPALAALRDATAARLMALHRQAWAGFPHTSTESGLRGHVSCFADLVYPILALSQFAAATGEPQSLAIARATADHVCRAQGPAGQWWWHYDSRSGGIVERSPVYSVHQHAMAPMALHALEQVSGASYAAAISRGLEWLASAPELAGGSLVDEPGRVVWRKVARHEPAKATRYLQALTSRVRPGASLPGIDAVFPPGAIDHECRPYEFGWFLYAWPANTRASWPGGVATQVTA